MGLNWGPRGGRGGGKAEPNQPIKKRINVEKVLTTGPMGEKIIKRIRLETTSTS